MRPEETSFLRAHTRHGIDDERQNARDQREPVASIGPVIAGVRFV
jgi:hypothetical protein